MALKTNERPEMTEKVGEDTVLLELALYTNYMWQGIVYTKGKAYRFKKNDAIKLLGERDSNRPIWRSFRAQRPKVQQAAEVVDVTTVTAPPEEEPIHGVSEEPRRIDVGDDSEIAEVLSRPDDVTL